MKCEFALYHQARLLWIHLGNYIFLFFIFFRMMVIKKEENVRPQGKGLVRKNLILGQRHNDISPKSSAYIPSNLQSSAYIPFKSS
jgi:hypothetical protein